MRHEGGKSVRNNHADPKVKEEWGEGGASGAEAGISPISMENTMVKQVFPLQPMEDHGGAHNFTAAGVGPLHWSRWIYPEGSCSL